MIGANLVNTLTRLSEKEINKIYITYYKIIIKNYLTFINC